MQLRMRLRTEVSDLKDAIAAAEEGDDVKQLQEDLKKGEAQREHADFGGMAPFSRETRLLYRPSRNKSRDDSLCAWLVAFPPQPRIDTSTTSTTSTVWMGVQLNLHANSTVCSGERQRIVKYMIENNANGLLLEDSLIAKGNEEEVVTHTPT
jgi:hypothetical protein